jgi:MFS family permease
MLNGTGLVSYYMTLVLEQIGVTDPNMQLVINAILQIVNIITAVGMCFFVDKIGRRKLFLISTSGMLGVFIVWTICSAQFAATGSTAAANAVIVVSSPVILLQLSTT